MRFMDWTDNPALDQFDNLMIVFACVNLDAHLRGDFRFGCCFANATRFPNVMGKRLLAIDVLAVMECKHRCKSMRMFAGADYNSIKFTSALKYFSKILFLPC